MSGITSFFRRNNATIAIAIVFVTFAAILYMQSLATAKIQEQINGQQQLIGQIKGVTQQINTSNKQSTQQIDQLNHHLDCIALFFAEPDRANKSITDINTCQLQTNSTGSISAPGARPMSSSGSIPGAGSTPATSEAAPVATRPTGQATSAPQQPSTLERTIINPVSNFVNSLLGVQ